MGSTFMAIVAAAAALVLVLAGLLGAATASVGGKCSMSADCSIGQWCLDCAGSRCVRSTATNPFQLVNNSLTFNKYAYLMTHNSFTVVGEPAKSVFQSLIDNQEDTVTAQLNNGVRALMLDTYDFKGDVWLCHSNCSEFTAFEPALDALKEIEAFLSANQSFHGQRRYISPLFLSSPLLRSCLAQQYLDISPSSGSNSGLPLAKLNRSDNYFGKTQSNSRWFKVSSC